MTLGDLVGKIIPGHSELVEIRDSDNYEICTTRSDRKGIAPYLDCEVIGWFPFDFTDSGGICVLVKEE